MNRQCKMMLVVLVLLLAVSGGFLLRLRTSQQLGKPGVLVANEPTYDPKGNVASTNRVVLPERVLDFSSEIVPVSEVEVSWLPDDTTFGKRRYLAPDGFATDLSVVLMRTDRGSIHRPQICLVGQGWTIDRTELEKVRIWEPHPYDLQVMKLTSSIQVKDKNGNPVRLSSVFVYWFVADGQLTPHHGERMWWMARDMIFKGLLQRWAYVTVYSICAPGQEPAAFERIKSFITAAVPQFQLPAGPRLSSAGGGELSQDRSESAAPGSEIARADLNFSPTFE